MDLWMEDTREETKTNLDDAVEPRIRDRLGHYTWMQVGNLDTRTVSSSTLQSSTDLSNDFPNHHSKRTSCVPATASKLCCKWKRGRQDERQEADRLSTQPRFCESCKIISSRHWSPARKITLLTDRWNIRICLPRKFLNLSHEYDANGTLPVLQLLLEGILI